MHFVMPGWAARGGVLSGRVQAFCTARVGGVSAGAYHSLNLGAHVDDDADAVSENRARVVQEAGISGQPLWLRQVHGSTVIHADDWYPDIEADAIVATRSGPALAILTADCLPVLLASQDGAAVAAAHAGWRGLADGVLGATVAALGVPPRDILAWIGPAISQAHYEVGDEVRERFVGQDHLATNCFVPNARERWQADLKALAMIALRAAGVRRITDAGLCTYALEDQFFSYRRSAPCGRMASVIRVLPRR